MTEKWFSYDAPGDDFQIHDTPKQARDAAEDALQQCREWACEGWDESVSSICWGRLSEIATMKNQREPDPEIHGDFDFICEYELEKP